MARTEILRAIAEINPAFTPQVQALLDCKARFCKITMKPNPEEDMRKRGGKVRVFIVNVRATYERMMRKHHDPNYRFDPIANASSLKARQTCTERAILGVVESVSENGSTRLQYRNVDLKRIASIECGDMMESFA